MNPDVKIRISALDQSKAAFASVEKKLTGLERKTQGFQNKIQDLQPAFRKMAAIGTAAFAGVTFAAGKAIQEAGKAEKISQNFENTFGESADVIDSFITDFGSKFAFIESEMKSGANSIGFQLNAMGGVGKEAAEEITTSLLTAAGGLSDFFGETVSVERAANAMAKALAGNKQSLVDMGYNVLDEDINDLAESMGYAAGEMTKVQEAQVLTKLIMDQTQGSIAGLDESMNTYTGQQRALRKATIEVSQTIGETLLPLMTDIMEKITPVIEKVTAWVSENEELTKKIIIATAAVAGIVAVVGALGMVLIPLIASFKAVAIVIAVLASPIGIIIALLGVIAVTFGSLALNWRENWETIKWATGIAVDWIGKKLNIAKGFLKDFVNFFIGVGEGMANSWVNAINTIIKALNTIQVSIPDWVPRIGGSSFGINIPEVPEVKIPRLAEGGIVTRSILANVGEAGPEAVIPLDKVGNMGGQNVTVNISGTFLDDRQAAKRMGDELVMTLKREMQLSF